LEKGDFDIFHPTGYNPYFLEYIKKPSVLTVYDMIHEKFPELYPKKDPTKIWKQKVIERADSIIAISKNTKQDIIQSYDIEPDRISVVYLGNPLEQALHNSNHKQFHKTPWLSSKYILFVGSRERYKNFQYFVSSITPLLQKHEDLYLFCAGGGRFTPAEKKQFIKLNILSKVHYFSINDEMMIDLYKNAQAFVFPSLYEGFGLPVLEAFSCGCPLIVSQTSSLSEIAGDAARYIDPYDEISIVDGVESLLNESKYREELIRKGYERQKLFSWEKTARETKKVYENIA
jgi:glycosyltransferase involved in cell wall biosynthesis